MQKYPITFIRTLFHRAKNLTSTDGERTTKEQHLRKALKRCRYRKWTFHTALKKTLRQREGREIQPISRPINIMLPYVANLSESVQRIWRSYNITTSFKPAETLRRHLVHPKDKIDKIQKSDVIYHIQCSNVDCRDTYIGETPQPLKRDCNNINEVIPVAAVSRTPTYNWDGTFI